jgi:hypothetical protein
MKTQYSLVVISCSLFLSLICKGQDKITFDGAFKQHLISWFDQQEITHGSIPSYDTTLYLFLSFPPKSNKYIRTGIGFEQSPTVEYVYHRQTKNVKQIHYEWDWEKAKSNNKFDTLITDSSMFLQKFVSQYKNLCTLITAQLGTSTREGQLYPNLQGSIEQQDTWASNEIQCTLYLVLYNKRTTYGIIRTAPTHRIRCDIIWKDN